MILDMHCVLVKQLHLCYGPSKDEFWTSSALNLAGQFYEFIAAMQNVQQLENKLSETKCSEFLGNILHNYEYANHMENSLDTFEFTHKNKIAKATPMF